MQATDNINLYDPLELNSWQKQVLEALRDKETKKYPLSEWYLGALYALDNPHNPDCVSQAAQSLRELLEKLPRVVQGSDVHDNWSGLKGMLHSIDERISQDKKRYPKGWKGEKIDGRLAKTLRKIEDYLERNRQPTRRQQMQQAVAIFDPMFDRLGSEIQGTKRKRLLDLWGNLEDFAHHKSKPDKKEFRKCLHELERTIIDLLALITAQDQREIQTILSRSNRSEDDVEQMFSLIERRGANFAFFFKHAAENADATWLPFLSKKGYFANPPNVQSVDDDSVIFPIWWPIRYLAKIADQAPDEVIEIIQHLPRVDNPRIYYEILEVALRLHGAQSAKLTPKILESTDINDQLLAFNYTGLLAHWVAENQTSAALELSKILVRFAPDPQSEAKQKRRRENPTPEAILETLLDPSPQISPRTYRDIMLTGVRPLAEKEPYRVARMLIDATVNMIRLQMHQEDMDQEEDYSEAWCKRLHELDRNYEGDKATLVHTLVFACEQVYERSSDSVVALDEVLRDQQWKVFKRLRQHLYAQYPNEITKPWIRELILEHGEYHLYKHHYEFQRMIRSACEYFGEKLLTEAERTQIFDAIRRGPSKERFQPHQRHFHRLQFRPFKSVLFGEYETFFQELEGKATAPICDDDYPPTKTRGGYVSNRSPHSLEDLASLTDEQLLARINDWEGYDFISEGDSFVEIDIEGLAGAFQTVFKETIIPDADRLRFWMENRERIARPIYVRKMIDGMHATVKEQTFDKLNEWLTCSEWVLSQPYQGHEEDYELGTQGDESRTCPSWHNSRAAVGNFIEACLTEEVEAPISVRAQLANLLEMLCTQFDRHLDRQETDLLDQNDLIDLAINSTRGLALRNLVTFGYWLRERDSGSKALEVTTILAKRFVPQATYPLTLPEYAILGRLYPGIFNLNKEWATGYKSNLFPQDKLPAWLAAFSNFLYYQSPVERTFEIFRNDFDFALQYLTDLKKRDGSDKEQTDSFGRPLKRNSPEEKLIEGIGEHLFTYYLWGMYPLRGLGENYDRWSLLQQYYEAIDNDREYWASLFNYVGSKLRNTSEKLANDWKDRIIAFFNWRFEVKEPIELQQFTLWLEAECLEAEWRLETYSKILDICKSDDVGIAIQVEALCTMLPDHTAKVLECFVKLTDGSGDNNIYIQTKEAKTILKVSLESSDESVRQNAELARENLLREGRFDLLDLDD